MGKRSPLFSHKHHLLCQWIIELKQTVPMRSWTCTPGKLHQSSKVVIARAYFQKELLCFRNNVVLGSVRKTKEPRRLCFKSPVFNTSYCQLIEVRVWVDLGHKYSDCWSPFLHKADLSVNCRKRGWKLRRMELKAKGNVRCFLQWSVELCKMVCHRKMKMVTGTS